MNKEIIPIITKRVYCKKSSTFKKIIDETIYEYQQNIDSLISL